jgi:hypothetical protein
VNLPDPDHVAAGPGAPIARPLRTAAAVIYATLALLALAVPGALVNWVNRFEPSPAQRLVLEGAQALQALSARIGTDRPYERAREAFLYWTGKRDD